MKEGLPRRSGTLTATLRRRLTSGVHRPGGYLASMLPLAVAGRDVLGAAVAFAVLFIWILLRAENRDAAREERDGDA
jgi:hypothetical protein